MKKLTSAQEAALRLICEGRRFWTVQNVNGPFFTESLRRGLSIKLHMATMRCLHGDGYIEPYWERVEATQTRVFWVVTKKGRTALAAAEAK